MIATDINWDATIKFEYESEVCGRCGGTGEYPSAAWQGACLGCARKGRVFTRAGKAVIKTVQQYLTDRPTVAVSEMVVGQRYIVTKGTMKCRTLVGIEATNSTSRVGDGPTKPLVQLTYKNDPTGYMVPLDAQVQVEVTRTELIELAQKIGKRKGIRVYNA